MQLDRDEHELEKFEVYKMMNLRVIHMSIEIEMVHDETIMVMSELHLLLIDLCQKIVKLYHMNDEMKLAQPMYIYYIVKKIKNKKLEDFIF